MSQNDDVNWTHFNVRCEKELRTKAEEDAKMRGQSLSEWIRRAMMEKLQNNSLQAREDMLTLSDAELKNAIREVVNEMLAEKKKRR